MIYMDNHKWCCSTLQCYTTMKTQEVIWIFDGKDWHGFCPEHEGDIAPFKHHDLKCTELKSRAQSQGLTALAKKREKVALVAGPILKKLYGAMPTFPPQPAVMTTMKPKPMARIQIGFRETTVSVDGKTVLRRRGPEEFEWVGTDYSPGESFKKAMKSS